LSIIIKSTCWKHVPRATEKISETEANEVIKVHDQALRTKHDARKAFKRATDAKCRICPQHDETSDHIMSVYPVLAKEQYTKHLRNTL
jgi:hypothetical protein